MSSINPNNINGQYPVAGQDNDSQGFRDNFTNIINNFTFAYNELTDLQQNALLKNPLNGTTLSNDMNYAQLVRPQLINIVETKNDLGTVSGAKNISWLDGDFQSLTTGGDVQLGITNWPQNGTYAKLRLQITTGANVANIQFPTIMSNVGIQSIQGYTSGQTISLNGNTVYQFELASTTNGGTLTIRDLLRNYNITSGSTSGSFTTVNATGNIVAQGGIYNNLAVNGNTAVGLAGQVSGSWHTIVGNLTQSSSGGNVFFNTAGNVLAATANVGQLGVSTNITAGGFVNVTGNVVAAGGVFSGVTVNGNQSVTGYVNATGNVLAAAHVGGAVTVTGAITTNGTSGIGYAAGAGGTVAQGATSEKNTTVTLNKTTGTITLHSGICLANARVANAFTLTNSTIGNQDLVVVQHVNVGALGGYSFAANTAVAGGSATIYVRNHTQLDLQEAIVLRFAVIKSTDA